MVEEAWESKKKLYQGFWREPETDGTWFRTSGHLRSVALELELCVDVPYPLAQASEHLGRVEAVMNIRVVLPAIRRELDRRPATARTAEADLEAGWLARFVEIDVA